MRNYIAEERVRKENIQHIFITTIFKMDFVADKYDSVYSRLSTYSKGKISYEQLHERALQLTLKLLS
jgi:predicted nucleic-acid-binding protein